MDEGRCSLASKVGNSIQLQTVILPTVVSPTIPRYRIVADIYGVEPKGMTVLQPNVGIAI
ncbi:hypothetical protein BRE01_60740 [Brevibacillus reuszeri]|uniref:Uncharacterized protein n=1 Tax=Brevibacillus reuszeri TaxID=54915 RepID=A0ABQ0TY75_9BACL|nr:hypothetical protein BRE01_60740 [Brevibacillus reuszeri]